MGGHSPVDAMSAAALLAGFVSGTLGALGLGGGSVLILYLTLFAGMEQAQAQGINLVFFVPCALLAVVLYTRKGLIARSLWLPAALFGLAGALLGSWLSGVFSSDVLQKLFGVLLLLFGIKEIFHRKRSSGSVPDKAPDDLHR